MTIAIEAVCRQCGRTFIPTLEDIRAGRWHLCPACRPDHPGAGGKPRDGPPGDRQQQFDECNTTRKDTSR